MRRFFVAGLVAGAISLGGLGTSSVAFAEEPAAHGGSEHEAAACTAGSTEQQCYEYWESHINWFSLDYRENESQAKEHRHMPPPFGFAIINFCIFAGIMYRLAANPLREFVKARHQTIRKDLDDAARLHREAEARLREYEAKISGLDEEISTLLTQVRGEAEAEKARIIAAAGEQAERLKAEADAQIVREIAAVRRELKQEAVATAITIAEQLLRQKATETDQVKLTERFVAELERNKQGGNPGPSGGSGGGNVGGLGGGFGGGLGVTRPSSPLSPLGGLPPIGVPRA